MENIIVAVIFVLISLASFVVSYLQFREKGFLFNNAYLYASKKERETMDKKPHYRQSAIVFACVGCVFLLNAVDAVFQTGWLIYVIIGIGAAMSIYAIVSSVKSSLKKP